MPERPRLDPSVTTQLLDLRDGVAEARALTAAAWLACGSPILDRHMSAALCAVTNVARERLEDLLTALDALVASVGAGDFSIGEPDGQH